MSRQPTPRRARNRHKRPRWRRARSEVSLPTLLWVSLIGASVYACTSPRVTGKEPWMVSQGAGVKSSGGESASGSQEAASLPPVGGDVEKVLHGRVSYYHDSLAGNQTANGEIYNPRKLTAASRTLPFDTRVRVVRKDTGRSVVVRVNDRGPFGNRRRILDLSRAAAKRLNMIADGVVEVRAEILEYGDR